jgi:hypothetical protein
MSLVPRNDADRPWVQGTSIALAGVVLAASSCYGFLQVLEFGGSLEASAPGKDTFGCALAVAFVLGGLGVVFGLLWTIASVESAKLGLPMPQLRKKPIGRVPPEI